MAPHAHRLSAYASQRLVSLFDMLSRKYVISSSFFFVMVMLYVYNLVILIKAFIFRGYDLLIFPFVVILDPGILNWQS